MIRTLVALLLAAVLAGCGGGGGGNKTTTTTGLPASTTVPRAKYTFPPTLLPEDIGDVNNASSVSLQLQDVPNGWRKSLVATSSRTPRPAMEDEVFVQCLFGDRPSPLTAYVVSDLFTSPDFTLTMRSFVRVVETMQKGAQDFSNFTAERIASCQDTMYDYEHNPPEGVTDIIGKKFGDAVPLVMPVDRLALTDTSTDTPGFRMIITPTDSVSTHQDIFAYGAGRYEVVILVQGTIVPDINMETDTVKRLRTRALAAAQLG